MRISSSLCLPDFFLLVAISWNSGVALSRSIRSGAKLKLSFERRFTVSLSWIICPAPRHLSRPRAIRTYFSSLSIPQPEVSAHFHTKSGRLHGTSTCDGSEITIRQEVVRLQLGHVEKQDLDVVVHERECVPWQ